MMGDRLVMQDKLFYEFYLDEFVPSNHMLRAIDRFVDLSDLRRRLGPFYSSIGRPSIDPESPWPASTADKLADRLAKIVLDIGPRLGVANHQLQSIHLPLR